MVKIGDKVRFVPASGADALSDGAERKRAVSGTVFYVNEAHRHFGVEAEIGDMGRKIRESFKF